MQAYGSSKSGGKRKRKVDDDDEVTAQTTEHARPLVLHSSLLLFCLHSMLYSGCHVWLTRESARVTEKGGRSAPPIRLNSLLSAICADPQVNAQRALRHRDLCMALASECVPVVGQWTYNSGHSPGGPHRVPGSPISASCPLPFGRQHSLVTPS